MEQIRIEEHNSHPYLKYTLIESCATGTVFLILVSRCSNRIHETLQYHPYEMQGPPCIDLFLGLRKQKREERERKGSCRVVTQEDTTTPRSPTTPPHFTHHNNGCAFKHS